MRRQIPQVIDNRLVGADDLALDVGSAEWFAWIAAEPNSSFSFQLPSGAATVRRERKRNGLYWYAYRNLNGKLRKAYLGKGEELTAERLRERIAALYDGEDAHAGLRLQLLGPPTLLADGKAVALASAKALALLAYLAVHELPQGRDHLIALLWPESTSAAGRKNLRNLLWSLRTTVGASLIEGDERLALRADLWADVRQFEQAYRELANLELATANDTRIVALAAGLHELYRGPLLDGVALDDAPDLELWLSSERERLQQNYLAALNRLVECHRAAARWNDVISIARAALSHDALQETLHQALMEAHARQGERAEALRQHETLRDLLDRELGVAPLPETEALRSAIRSGAIQPRRPVVQPSVAPRRMPSAPYIGRQAELAALDGLWNEAQESGARVALLAGEAGIGKSRLWQTWAARLPDGITVLEARCLQTTRSLPFAPLAELLRTSFLPNELPLLLAGRERPPAWLAELSRLLPELRDTLPNLPQPQPLVPDEEQRRTFEALVQSLQLAPDRPLVLFIDDLHWADRATLDWLGYLVHRAHNLSLLLVGAYRAEEMPMSLGQLIVGWTRGGVLRRLMLNRLDRAETAALVDALGGDQSRLDALYDQSAGNPYFVRELLHTAPDHVPAALVDLISERLDQLPDEARQVIQAAAVLQPYSDFAALCRTSGRDEGETLDAIDLLVQRGLLVERGNGLAFNHPLITHVVDGSLSGARRAQLHRRAAEAWLALAGAHSDELAGRLATHFREAGDNERAAHYAELAGDQALSVGAPVEAGQFYEQALELHPNPQRWYGFGLAHYWQGDLQGARAAFIIAHEGAKTAGDGRGAMRACLELARISLASGRGEEVVRWVTLGRSYLGDQNDPTAQAMAAYLLGTGMRISDQSLVEAEASLQEARRCAQDAHAESLMPMIFFELGNVWAQRGDLPLAIDYYHQTSAIAQQHDDALNTALGYNNAAYHAALLGDFATAHHDIERGLALAEERGLDLSRQWLYSTRGELALAEGAWGEAEHWLQRGVALAESFGNSALVAGYHANLARATSGRGDLETALADMQAARKEADACTDRYLLCRIDLWLAELHHARGETAASIAALARADAFLANHDYALLRQRARKIKRMLDA